MLEGDDVMKPTDSLPDSTVISEDCLSAQALIVDHLGGDSFPVGTQTQLDEHLFACANCRAYLENYRRLTTAIRQLPQISAPEGLEDRIMAAISQVAIEPVNPRQNPWRAGINTLWANKVPIAATFLAMAVVLPLLVQRFTPNGEQAGQAGPMQASGSATLQHVATPDTASSDNADIRTDNVVDDLSDLSELASAQTTSVTSHDSVVSTNPEGDIYFDPVSQLVEF
jgi:hypothetical protein